MNEKLRVLLVEDSEADAELVCHELERAGYSVHAKVVDNREEMRLALATEPWDAVVSDYRVPHFDAPEALEVLRESGQDLPFLVVSGTVAEEIAVQMMKSGAHDFLTKDNLKRLAPAVEREIREAETRHRRRQAEQALRESESRLRLALESSRMAVWEWDVAADSVLWSPGCAELLGIPDQDSSRTSLIRLVHRDDLERVRGSFQRALAERSVCAAEFRIVRPDGEERWVSTLSQGSYDEQGRPLRLVGTVQDVTGRKRGEQALERSEAMLQSVVASALDAVIVTDWQGAIRLWNPAAEQMFGYQAAEILGQPLHRLFVPETRLGGSFGHTRELVAKRSDGSEFPVELTAAAVEGPETGQAVRVIRDITGRKTAEAALRESEQRWQFALDGAGEGVWDWSSETGNTYYSHQWKAMLGYEDRDIVNQPQEWDTRLHPDDRDAVRQALRKHIEGASPMYEAEYRLRCKDDSYKWILGRGKVVQRDAEGRPLRIIGTHTDITPRKAAEEERQKLQAQFLQAQKMESIGRLAGGVAHDFNNFLTVINGYSALVLRRLAPNDPSREAVEQIHSSGERAAVLVRQLLAFSRKESALREMVDINRLVADLEKTVLRLMGDDVQIVTRLEPTLDSVLADRHQLEQVLLNLVVNARDAMPRGGTLTVETSIARREGVCQHCHTEVVPGNYVRMTIRDTGIGIDEFTMKRLFEPFFTTKQVGKGSGLGLSVVHGIITQNGGHVQVESVPGVGTAFHVDLPPAQGLGLGCVVSPPSEATGNETVLLVEDETEVRRFMVAVLESYGYRVMQAPNGAHALALLAAEHVDILITDVMMPGMNGYDLALKARERQPALRILFVSGYADDQLRIPTGAADAGFLQKPFEPQALAAKLRETMGAGGQGPKATILLVDDEAGVRSFLRAVLEEGGYTVVEKSDGSQALEYLVMEKADLIITDLVMPEQEGIETIQLVRRHHPQMKIIAMSGAASGRYLALAKPLGAHATLMKPISRDVLLTQVRAVLQAP